MCRKIMVNYNVYGEFMIPKNIPLLSSDDNVPGLPFSWYVKWNTLHYLDADGNEMTIEPRYDLSTDFKCPDGVEEDETDDDEEC
jgi:hypothetical protein